MKLEALTVLLLVAVFAIRGANSAILPDFVANAEQCYIPGEWFNCEAISVDKITTYDNCLALCKATAGCTHFTFSPEGTICETFHGPCVNITTDGCTNCVSGESTCSSLGDLECEVDYCCHGKVIETLRDSDFRACRDECNKKSGCQWFSFYIDTSFCQLMDSKGNATDEAQGKCKSGQHGCQDSTVPECKIQGMCNGNILAPVSVAATPEKCLEYCRNFKPAEGSPECGWVSYHNPDFLCYLFDTCDGPLPAPSFVSGEKRCETLETGTTAAPTEATTTALETSTTAEASTTTEEPATTTSDVPTTTEPPTTAESTTTVVPYEAENNLSIITSLFLKFK